VISQIEKSTFRKTLAIVAFLGSNWRNSNKVSYSNEQLKMISKNSSFFKAFNQKSVIKETYSIYYIFEDIQKKSKSYFKNPNRTSVVTLWHWNSSLGHSFTFHAKTNDY
jgi:hypothetical protein